MHISYVATGFINFLSPLPPDQLNNKNDNRDQEHDDRDPVHAMHEFGVGVHRPGLVPLADVEIFQYLAPDAFNYCKDR